MKTNMSAFLELMGRALYIMGLGKKDVSHLKEITLAVAKGKGKR